MPNKKIIIGSVLLIGLLLFMLVVGASAYVLFGPGIGSSPGNTKYWHQCDVVVDENLIGKDISIKSASCKNTGNRCGLLYSIFSIEGSVEMHDSGGKIASAEFETDAFTGKDSVILRGCSNDNVFDIRLYEDTGLASRKLADSTTVQSN